MQAGGDRPALVNYATRQSRPDDTDKGDDTLFRSEDENVREGVTAD